MDASSVKNPDAVHVVQGENLAPSYLRINPKGAPVLSHFPELCIDASCNRGPATVPSLVVPLEKSLAPDCEVRFKSINDTRVRFRVFHGSDTVLFSDA